MCTHTHTISLGTFPSFSLWLSSAHSEPTVLHPLSLPIHVFPCFPTPQVIRVGLFEGWNLVWFLCVLSWACSALQQWMTAMSQLYAGHPVAPACSYASFADTECWQLEMKRTVSGRRMNLPGKLHFSALASMGNLGPNPACHLLLWIIGFLEHKPCSFDVLSVLFPFCTEWF